jgi:anti-sigma B factor antagonist
MSSNVGFALSREQHFMWRLSVLDMSLEADGNGWLLTVVGDVDLATADDLAGVGLRAVRAKDAARLIIDVRSVGFVDSVGLGALIEVRNAAEATGCEITLRNPGEQFAKLLSITGLEETFGATPGRGGQRV